MRFFLCLLTGQSRRIYAWIIFNGGFSGEKLSVNLVSDYIFISFFRLGAVMCMGVTAGAYILTLFAVCTLSEIVFPP